MTSKTDIDFFFVHLLGLKSKTKVKHLNANNMSTMNGGNVSSTFNTPDTTHSKIVKYSNQTKHELYKSIPKQTIDKLATCYKDDIKLWQEHLEN